jgi:hypothetical protein
MGWLHRVVDRSDELAFERLEVDLVAHAGRDASRVRSASYFERSPLLYR